MESPKSNQKPQSPVAAKKASASAVATPAANITYEMRIEKQCQSIKHIDTVNRAIMACRLQFWDKSNNPIGKAQVSVFENGNEKDGKLIYKTDTNVDGEADIEFVMDIVQEVRKELYIILKKYFWSEAKKTPYFSTSTKHVTKRVSGGSHIFLLADDNNGAMRKKVDDILLRKSFQDDSEALLKKFNDSNAVRAFKVKYEGRVSAAWINDVLAQVEKRIKWQQLREKWLNKVNSEIGTREILDDDKMSFSRLLGIEESIPIYKYEDYTPWINNVAVCEDYFDEGLEGGSFLINRQGRKISAFFTEIKHHAGNVWKARFQDQWLFINNKGRICDINGKVINTKSRDNNNFPLPDMP